MLNVIFKLLIVFCSLYLSWVPGAAPARGPESGKSPPSGLWGGLAEDLEYSLRVVTFGTCQGPSDSTQNPGNEFLGLPRYRADVEIRPDISMNRWRLHLSVRPRISLEGKKWEQGTMEGETLWNEEWYFNEWISRLQVSDDLFISYGRENLQWGPSYLLSPSNPFFRDNGRSNPKREVPGTDFARLVWLPDPAWTVSFIANTDQGRQSVPSGLFRKCYALKLDFNGQESYGSLILSRREGERNRLGFFAGRTATDALLLYSEGTLARGSDAYYPQAEENPFGAVMKALYEKDSSLQTTMLIGGSYTLRTGPTLTVEYVFNSEGYGDSDAEIFYRLRGNAADAIDSTGPVGGLAAQNLSLALDPGLRLLRRNTVMFQYNHNDIRDVLNLTLRWTRGLDDHSGQFLSVLEYFLTDHMGVFSIGVVNTGGGDTEFGSILDFQWMVGLEYTF